MRAFWSGEIAFGLVTIPAKLYTATRDLRPRFHLLHKECGTPIATVRRCPKHDRDLSWDEIGKGYEVAKGEYVLFTPEELAKLDGEDTAGAIEIVQFVDPLEVDLAYVDKSYWVGPGGRNLRGYELLRRVLGQTHRVALSRTRLRTRTRLALLRPRGRLFALDMLRFAEEVVAADEIEPVEGKPASRREADLATHLVDQLSGPFDPAKHPDQYRNAVLAAAQEKVEAGEARRAAPEAEAREERGRAPGQVIDLSALLAQSIEGAGKGRGARRPGPVKAKGRAPAKAEAPAEHARKRRRAG
jgi:DNA end-binding protein Ku